MNVLETYICCSDFRWCSGMLMIWYFVMRFQFCFCFNWSIIFLFFKKNFGMGFFYCYYRCYILFSCPPLPFVNSIKPLLFYFWSFFFPPSGFTKFPLRVSFWRSNVLFYSAFMVSLLFPRILSLASRFLSFFSDPIDSFSLFFTSLLSSLFLLLVRISLLSLLVTESSLCLASMFSMKLSDI